MLISNLPFVVHRPQDFVRGRRQATWDVGEKKRSYIQHKGAGSFKEKRAKRL